MHNIDDHCLPNTDKYLQSDCKTVECAVFIIQEYLQLLVTASGEEPLQWARHLVKGILYILFCKIKFNLFSTWGIFNHFPDIFLPLVVVVSNNNKVSEVCPCNPA